MKITLGSIGGLIVAAIIMEVATKLVGMPIKTALVCAVFWAAPASAVITAVLYKKKTT